MKLTKLLISRSRSGADLAVALKSLNKIRIFFKIEFF